MSCAHSFNKAMAQVHQQVGGPQPQRVIQMNRAEHELTPWFNAYRFSEQPRRDGWYDTRRECHGEIRLYWNTSRRSFFASPESHCPLGAHREWRGLTQESK